ncbi:MAG: hypothetical protein ACLQVA_13615 [Candidatus Brocadiia bacterium]
MARLRQNPTAQTQPPQIPAIGWPHAVRDIFVTAISKGQLVGVGLILIVVLIILKMPGEKVSELTTGLYDDLKHYEMYAYFLLIIETFAWVWTHRSLQKATKDELTRMAKERDRVQAAALGNLGTSASEEEES